MNISFFICCIKGDLDGEEEIIVGLGWTHGGTPLTTTEIYNLGDGTWRSGPVAPSSSPTIMAVRGAYDFLVISSGAASTYFFDTINLEWVDLGPTENSVDLRFAGGVIVVDNKDYPCWAL